MLSKSEIKKLIDDRVTEDKSRDFKLAVHFLSESKQLSKALKIFSKALKEGTPFPYAFGYTLVGGLKIEINKNVLHPGPETLSVIERSIKEIKRKKFKTVLDLCTGSGAVAVSIAKKSNAIVTAVDISDSALKIARKNAKMNAVGVKFIKSDMFSALSGKKFDIIISNPPYVRTKEIRRLPKFIKDFSPKIAIDGGKDGLYFHKIILESSKKYLNPGGILIIECEDGQDKELEKLMDKNKWKISEKIKNRFDNIRGFVLRSTNK